MRPWRGPRVPQPRAISPRTRWLRRRSSRARRLSRIASRRSDCDVPGRPRACRPRPSYRLGPAFSPELHPHQCRALTAQEPHAGVGAARWGNRPVAPIMRSCGLPRAVDDVRHLIDASGKIGGHVADDQWHGHLLILLKQASNMRANEDIGKVP
jgi:hypothetical protein